MIFFDCKSQIYDLKSEYSKRELAKDVSSFANSNGGYILIGLKTEKSKTHFSDKVIEILLLDQNLVDVKQYKNVIRGWTYPDEIKGLEVYWKASKNDSRKGIVIIKIPYQNETSKPFLITKTVNEGEKISEIIFGYAERRRDESDPKEVKDIFKIMRDGLLYDKNIENRFNNLESLIQTAIKENRGEERRKYKDVIEKRINKILEPYEK